MNVVDLKKIYSQILSLSEECKRCIDCEASLYFIYRYRVPPITFTRISNKNGEELVKLTVKVIKRMRKKRRPKGISRIIHS